MTWFELVEVMSEHALLDVRLESGRTHQIRVHLAAVDLPVSGDATYGVKRDLGLERQFLHAHRLRFVHPITQVELDLESPLPPDLGAGAREGARQLDFRGGFRPFDPATSRGGGAVALSAVPPGPSVIHHQPT